MPRGCLSSAWSSGLRVNSRTPRALKRDVPYTTVQALASGTPRCVKCYDSHCPDEGAEAEFCSWSQTECAGGGWPHWARPAGGATAATACPPGPRSGVLTWGGGQGAAGGRARWAKRTVPGLLGSPPPGCTSARTYLLWEGVFRARVPEV